MIGLLAALAVTGPALCATASFPADHPWLAGDYRVAPVAQHYQEEWLEKLKGEDFFAIDPASAKTISGEENGSASHRYYVARAGYYGTGAAVGVVPGALTMGLEVDSAGVGYVTTLLPGQGKDVSELAVVLVSQTRLEAFVSLCSTP